MSQQPTNLPATREPRQIIEVQDAIPMLDTARFEHMQRIASVMAHSSLIPESLYSTGTGTEKKPLPMEQVTANCFLIVNQAVRWNYDPFAVAQCVSVIHGKLCYEGKLVDAVLETKLGVDLDPEYIGEPKDGDAFGIKLSGEINGKLRTVEGTVGDWKTKDKGGATQKQWTGTNARRQLAYRATREWARLYAPAVMLGVYTPDEMDDLGESARARRARDVTPARPPDPFKPEPIHVPLSKQGQGRHDEAKEQEGGEATDRRSVTERTDETTPEPQDDGGSGDAPDDALVPPDDSGAAAAEWITFMPHADTAKELRDYATDEHIWEHIDAGHLDERTAEAVKRAYDQAMGVFEQRPPDPNVRD